jgi:hypothetical protein
MTTGGRGKEREEWEKGRKGEGRCRKGEKMCGV